MKNENIAIGVLIIIIVAAVSIFLVAAYNEEILLNLFGEPEENKIIAEGDLVDVNYIGRYASNNTIFDTSYQDVENKSDGTPLNIFVTFNATQYPPEGYEQYATGFIEGFLEGLIGLKDGETSTIGPIPPEKAYGSNVFTTGSQFSTNMLAVQMNMNVEVIEKTNDYMSLQWIDINTEDPFTAPQYIVTDFAKLEEGDQDAALIIVPPLFLWENATEIISSDDVAVTAKTTPTTATNLVEQITPYYLDSITAEYIFPNATIATWDNDTITITHSPEVGQNFTLSLEFYGSEITTIYTVEEITDTMINLSIQQLGTDEIIYQNVNKSYTFNRTLTIPRLYQNISNMLTQYIYVQDIQAAGYSIHPLAGETLLFEVTIENVIKGT